MTTRSRWALALWLILLGVCAVIIANTRISTDMSAFLPRSPSPAQQLLVEQLRDGVVSRLILIGIEGGNEGSAAAASRELAARLRQSPNFISINNGEDVGGTKDREFLWNNRYLLSPAVNAERYSVAGLRAALEEQLQLLASPMSMLLQRTLPNDPTGEIQRLLELMQGQTRPHQRDGVWFSKDGSRALLLAQTRAGGDDIDGQERAVDEIRAEFARLRAAGAMQKLLISGPAVFAVSIRASIKHDAWRFSVIATTLIATLLLILYRSVFVLGLGLLPVASGALAGVTAVALGFGSVHGLTLAFGVTLIGEGVDYAIYLFTHIAPDTTADRALARIWPTLRLGLMTSICGFSAMLFSGFTGLAQLGLFSIAGLLVAASVTRWVLPALLPRDFHVSAGAALAAPVQRLMLHASSLRWVVVIAVVMAAIFLATRDRLWSDDVASLSPVALNDQLLDKELRGDIGAPDLRHLVIVAAPDQETALQTSEKIAEALTDLVRDGALDGYDTPSAYLPSAATQNARRGALPPPAELRQRLERALNALPFKPGIFEPFIHDIERARRDPLLERRHLEGTLFGLKLDSLLLKRNERWIAMLPLRGVHNRQAIERALKAWPEPQVTLLDIKGSSSEMYQSYLREAVSHSLLGGAAIVVLLSIALRSARRVFQVLAPLAAAVIVTCAIVAFDAGELSIFHLIGLLLVVAVGSNYSLFFDRDLGAFAQQERTAVSLSFANISTVIGFGVLAFSQLPVLKAIGLTVAIGAILSLVFAAVLTARIVPAAAAPRE